MRDHFLPSQACRPLIPLTLTPSSVTPNGVFLFISQSLPPSISICRPSPRRIHLFLSPPLPLFFLSSLIFWVLQVQSRGAKEPLSRRDDVEESSSEKLTQEYLEAHASHSSHFSYVVTVGCYFQGYLSVSIITCQWLTL